MNKIRILLCGFIMLPWYLHEHGNKTCATLMSNETWLCILSNPRQFVMCLSLIKSAQIAKQ
jgi:hypothetical protein